MRRATPILVLSLLASVARAEPPRGRRPPRVQPTHVVLAETTVDAGGLRVTLEAGAAVAVPGQRPAGVLPRRKLKATTTGGVTVTGSVDGTSLGQRVARDTELKSPDGRTVLGIAPAGLLVRVVAGKAPAGMTPVEALGPVTARGLVAKDALTAESRTPVVADNWNARTRDTAELRATPELRGAPLARLAARCELVGIEQTETAMHVRTIGGARLEGWLPLDAVELRKVGETSARLEPQLIKPTHEAFVDTAISATPGGKPAGMVLGGTLLEVSKDTRGPFTKVLTRGPIVVSGWVRTDELRALDAAVWAEPPVN